MNPHMIDLPTLEWVVAEIKKEIERCKFANNRVPAFMAALDEMQNIFECVISRVQRGEGLYPTSVMMELK